MTYRDLAMAILAMNDLTDNRLPGPLSVKLFRSKKVLADAYSAFVEARDATHDHMGGPFERGSEAYQEYIQEVTNMLDQEVDLEAPCPPVSVPVLALGNASVKPDSLGTLEHLGLITVED